MLQTKLIHKKVRFPWLVMFLVLALLLFSGWRYVISQYQPVDETDKTYQAVTIPSQSGARQIAGILRDHDLIRNERLFLNYLSSNKLDNQLQAGNYKFSRSQTMEEIADAIVSGRVDYLTVTIPEGYTVKEIGLLLQRQGMLTEEQWQESIGQPYPYDFLKGIPAGEANWLEGFLFPDTYNISEGASGQQIVDMMLKRFDRAWGEEFAALAEGRKQSVLEIVTIASLIEREAARPQERETISGVIANRMKIGMPLQIDATILYALDEHKELIYNADLKVDSPYNTYTHTGLPPGPIASPGEESLYAALHPEEHPYFYYVSRGDGSHEFNRTFAEHLQAISKYNNQEK